MGSSNSISTSATNSIKSQAGTSVCSNTVNKSPSESIQPSTLPQLKKCPIVIDRGKLLAIRMVLNNDRFIINFYDIIQQHGKGDYYDFYEDLETLRKITRSTRNPHTRYKLVSILSTCRRISKLLPSCRRTTPSVDTDLTEDADFCSNWDSPHLLIDPAILACILPLLTYSRDIITIHCFHKLLGKCQNNLLAYLIPEFDIYLEKELYYNNALHIFQLPPTPEQPPLLTDTSNTNLTKSQQLRRLTSSSRFDSFSLMTSSGKAQPTNAPTSHLHQQLLQRSPSVKQFLDDLSKCLTSASMSISENDGVDLDEERENEVEEDEVEDMIVQQPTRSSSSQKG